jgi:hypothetical protein
MEGIFCGNFFKLPGVVASMPEHMACRVLHVPGRTTLLPDDSQRG